jgi:hypothetical protein
LTPNQTSRYNPGSTHNASAPYLNYLAMVAQDAAGASSVTCSATASYTATTEPWVSVALSLVPQAASPIGSSFRAYRTGTGTASLSSGNQKLPNSFFDTTSSGDNAYCTSDLTYATATANQITISNAGTYQIELSIAIAASAISGAEINLLLYRNGTVVARKQGAGVSSGQWSPSVLSTSFTIYCAAGDTLQPGAWASGSISNCLTGESTGTMTVFAVALDNRGVLS